MDILERIKKAKEEGTGEYTVRTTAPESDGMSIMSRINRAKRDKTYTGLDASTRTVTTAQEPSSTTLKAPQSQAPSAGELAGAHKAVSEELDRGYKTYEENESALRRILDTASSTGDLSQIAADVSKIEQVYGVSPKKSGSMSQYLSDIQKLYSAPEIGALESARAKVAGQYYYAKNSEAQARLDADTGAKKTYEGLKDVMISEANIRRLRDQVERGEDRTAWDADAQLVEKYFGVTPEGSGSTVQYLADLQRLLDTDAAAQLGGEMRTELEGKGYDTEGLLSYEARQKLAQEAARQQKDIAEATGKNWLSGLGMNVLSVAASPLQGFEYIGQLLGNIGHNDTSDLEKYIPLDKNAMPVTNTVRTIRGTTAENINNKVISWLYENGMSIADSAAEVAAFGPASVFVMGGSAAANQMRDVLERGGTNHQAILSGAAAGAAEILFEKISIDNLLSQKSVSGWRSWLRETAKQAGVEASEEMFTEVANILSDAAIMGENSEFSQRVSDYTSQGLSASEAKKKAFLDSVGQVALAGAGGALSGGVMGGVVNAYNGVRTSQTQPRPIVDEVMENLLGPVETQEKAPAQSRGEEQIAEMMDAIMGPADTEGQKGTPEEGNQDTIAEDEQKKSAPEGGNTRLSDIDEADYMRTGSRPHIKASKQAAVNAGEKIVLTTNGETQNYIRTAINGDTENLIPKAYGKVGSAMADDIYSRSSGAFDVEGWYLELVPSDLRHAYLQHGDAKQSGNIPLTEADFLNIPDYIDTYDDILECKTFKNGEKEIVLGKKINGYSVIVEIVSNSRKSLSFKNMWGVDTATYEAKYKNSIEYRPSRSSETANDSKGTHNDAVLSDTLSQSVPSVNPETQNDGLGAAGRGFSTPTRGEIVYTQNNTMNPGADFTAEESERYAPGVHESVSEEMSLERAMGRFYQDENGHFVNLEDTIDELLEKESWTGVDQDAAQVAFRWMNAHRKSLTDEQYSRFWALHKAIEEIGGSEAGRSLQARQKWVSSGDGIVSKAMSLMDDPRIDRKAAREVIDHVADLAEKYDRAVSDGNNVSFAEIVREAAAARNTAKKDGNLTRSVEWALKQILEHNDVEFMKNAARASIIAMAQDHVPTSPSAKAKAIRRTFMLSKAATWSRNVDSNNIFDPIDSIARDISVPLDMLLSKFTKTRSVAADATWFSKAKRKGTKYALARSLLEVGLDISAEGAENKYGQAGNRTFKMSGGPVERFFSRWEQLLGYAMYSTDQMQKGGIQSEVQRGIDRLYEQGKIADDSLRDAGMQEATYRTFQADTGIAKGFLKFRQGLNDVAHIGDIGLGDFIMPFVQVPTNLVDIAIDYSPAGLAKGVVGLTKALYDAHNGTMTAAQQARAVQTIGRSLTGASLVALSVLARVSGVLLIADDGREEDKDKTTLESQSGLSGTQINLSGLLRLLTGGSAKKQPGDVTMSIGFLEPFNALLNMGGLIADDYIAEHEGEKNGITIGEIFKDTVAGTVQATAELPVMSPFSDAINAYNYSKADAVGGKLTDAGLQFVAGQVSSFIPNSLKGIAQGTDTKRRDLYSSGTLWGRTWDSIKAGIPGLRQTLPAKLDSYGNEIDAGEPVLNFLNNNILPGSITQYQPRNEVIDPKLEELYKATGSVKQYPDRNPPNSISRDIDGDGKNEKFELTAEEKRKFQQTRGDIIEELFSEVLNKKKKLFTPEEMVDILANIKSYAGTQAKKEFYEDHDIEADTTVNFIGKAVAGVQEAGIPFVTYLDFWCKKDKLDYEVDEKGKKKVKEAVVKLIDSMKLTDAQKDWLYNEEGYKGDVTWH